MVAVHVDVSVDLITWALERARISIEDAGQNVNEWISGDKRPTYKQLEDFARRVRAPFGYFFLEVPPEEVLPMPDFRTLKSQAINRPSPDLIDSIHDCQRKQAWYIEYAIDQGFEPLEFVSSVSIQSNPDFVAEKIRAALRLDANPLKFTDSTETRRQLIERIEDLGVLVIINGIVGSNTRRALDVEEFRGFTLMDKYAPLIFVNGADAKTAQCFTLLHELSHIWAGQSALSDADMQLASSHQEELWANQVAAETLVPKDKLQIAIEGLGKEAAIQLVPELSRQFGVSSLVILRSFIDLQVLNWEEYQTAAKVDRESFDGVKAKSSGGNFYNSQRYRVSSNLAQAVIREAREGRTLYREAYSLLGVRSHQSFDRFAEKLGLG